MSRAIVFGAGGAVGEAIARALQAKGYDVIGAARTPRASLKDLPFETRLCDLSAPESCAPLLAGAELAVFAPILTLSAPVAKFAAEAGVARAIFLSSNNVAADAEAPIYRALAAAEARVLSEAPQPLILRPTLLYGDPRLETLPRLARLMRRLHVAPLPGSGRALQQPLFHGDLAQIVVSETAGGIVSVGGPERVTMRALYEQLAQAIAVSVLIAPIPKPLLSVARLLPGFPLSAAQIARADADRVAPFHALAKTKLDVGLAHLAAAMQ